MATAGNYQEALWQFTKYAIAIGDAIANASKAIAIGQGAKAYKECGVAIGYGASATGSGVVENNTAIGNCATASGSRSTAVGHFADAEGLESVAIGCGCTAANDYQFACGRYNASGTNLVFTFGQGTSTNNTLNIMTLDSSGNEVISGSLTQHSDGRYKKVIGDAPDLSGVRAVLFKWTEDKPSRDDKEHIGYIAQDVEKVAPYLVQENESGIKTLDYIALLCAKVDQLERTVERMAKRIDELEGRIA